MCPRDEFVCVCEVGGADAEWAQRRSDENLDLAGEVFDLDDEALFEQQGEPFTASPVERMTSSPLRASVATTCTGIWVFSRLSTGRWVSTMRRSGRMEYSDGRRPTNARE